MKTLIALAAPLLAVATPTFAATIGDLRDHRRVLLVAAPASGDPVLAKQREVLARWRQGAADRDVSVVEIVGDRLTGADDPAASLRQRYRLPAARFAAILIGKDGHVALRSAAALTAAKLEATIDAMPMRRAGER